MGNTVKPIFPPKWKNQWTAQLSLPPSTPHAKKILLHMCTKNIPISMDHSTDYCFAIFVFKPGVAVTAAYTVLSGMSGLF